MNRFDNGKINPIFIILGIIVLGSLMVTIISQRKQNNGLQVYDEENTVENLEVTTEDKKIESFTIADDNAGFSLKIPNEWQKIDKNGYSNYIHSPSATSVGIEVLDYDPLINSDNETSLSTEITNNGYGFVSFQKKTTSSYEVIYQSSKDGLYDYIDEVLWSRNNIVKLHFIVNDEYFNKMSPYLDSIYNSFKWNDDVKIINENVDVIYFEYGDFEFGVPLDWSLGSENNVVYSSNEDGTASMKLEVTENGSSLADVSGYDVTNVLQPSRNNGFMLQGVQSEQTKVTATASYLSADGINMVNKTYIYTNGVFQYNFQFDYVSGTLDDTYTDELMTYYREFYLIHNKDRLESTQESSETSTEITTEGITAYTTEELTTESISTMTDAK